LTKNKIFLKYFQIYPTISHFCGVGGAKINVLASFFMPFVNFYIKTTRNHSNIGESCGILAEIA
jgi:hypothetical protein